MTEVDQRISGVIDVTIGELRPIEQALEKGDTAEALRLLRQAIGDMQDYQKGLESDANLG